MLLNSSHNYAQEEKSFKIAVSSKGMLVLDQLSSGVSCKWSESSDLENYDEIRLLKQMPIGCALSESENAVFFCEKFQEKIKVYRLDLFKNHLTGKWYAIPFNRLELISIFNLEGVFLDFCLLNDEITLLEIVNKKIKVNKLIDSKWKRGFAPLNKKKQNKKTKLKQMMK